MEIPWTTVARPTDETPEVVVMGSRFQLANRWRSPLFLIHSLRLWRQARRTPGILGVSLRAQPLKGTFWTLSAWSDRAAITGYAGTDPHAAARNKIKPWTKESTFRFWTIPTDELPTKSAQSLWTEAERRITESDA